MAAYQLDKTLSDHGTVARGICEVSPDGLLLGVEEITDLARRSDGVIASGNRTFAPGSPVSMNFWGFTPQIFPLLEKSLREFLTVDASSEKAECYIPAAVAGMIAAGEATVRVLPTTSEWFGVTYREDRPRVVASIANLVATGAYGD